VGIWAKSVNNDKIRKDYYCMFSKLKKFVKCSNFSCRKQYSQKKLPETLSGEKSLRE
jgi:hypothetical protein